MRPLLVRAYLAGAITLDDYIKLYDLRRRNPLLYIVKTLFIALYLLV